MAITEKELLLGFIGKSLNLPEDGVTSLIYNDDGTELKEDALTTLLGKQQHLVKKWKDDSSKFQQGIAKGKSDAMKELEETLRDKFEIDSERKGAELVDDIVESVRTKAGSKEVTDDDVKRHKVYQDTMTEHKRQLKKVQDDAKAELDKVTATHAKEKTFATIQQKALEILESKKPILSSDPAKAARQKKLLLDELKQFDFEIQGEGDDARVVVMKNGKLHEDTYGHAVEFNDLVNKTSDLYYDFEEADERSSGGDPNKKGTKPATPPAGGKGSGSTFSLHGVTLKKPTSEKEFMDQYSAIQANKDLKPEQKTDLSLKLSELNKQPVSV
jgi:hypothetical protein